MADIGTGVNPLLYLSSTVRLDTLAVYFVLAPTQPPQSGLILQRPDGGARG
jgi:hypothetical protein